MLVILFFFSRAYLDNFFCALYHEYGHQGIFVQSLVPFQVAPHGASAGGWLIPQSDVYARHAISTLGISHRTTGYWPHTLQVHRSVLIKMGLGRFEG